MDAACEVIGLAFEGNPNTLAVVGGDRSKARRLMQAAVRAGKLGRKYSHVLLAEDEGRVVGVLNAAEWPNCQLSIGGKLKAAPGNVVLYEKFGFKVVAQEEINGVNNRFMWRPAHS